jgi:molecular chaperone GrpE
LDEEYKQEDEKCRDVLARTMADFDNFKKRTERDKQDMIFFLKSDLFKKILPRIDDLERIIKNTPENEQN